MKIKKLALIVFLIIFAFFAPIKNINAATFDIEWLSSDIVKITAQQKDYPHRENVMGYGQALGDGLKIIAKQYTIIEIIPIQYYIGYGSATKEIIVRVKKK